MKIKGLSESFVVHLSVHSKFRCKVFVFVDYTSMNRYWKRLGYSRHPASDGSYLPSSKGKFLGVISLTLRDTEFLETAIHECIHVAMEYLNRIGVSSFNTEYGACKLTHEKFCVAVDWMVGAIVRRVMFRQCMQRINVH